MEDARDLISSCVGQAVRRLRFFRLAYGSHHGSMDWSGAMQTGAAMLADSKIEFAWQNMAPMTALRIRISPAPENWR